MQIINPKLSANADETFTYELRVQDEFGCVDTDEIKVKVVSKPKATIKKTSPFCGRSDGKITFNFADHPNHRFIEFSLNGKNGPYRRALDQRKVLVFKNLSAGNYYAWVRWGDGDASCPVSLGKITLEDLPGPKIDAGPDLVICEGQSIRLKVKGNANWKYTWKNGAVGQTQTINPTFSKYENRTLTYTVKAEDENGCTTVDHVKVTVLSKPKAKIKVAHPHCGQDDGSIIFNFTGHPNQRFMEFSINGKGGPYTRVLGQRKALTFKNLAKGNYYAWVRWGAEEVNCPVYLGPVSLKDQPAPQIDIGKDVVICEGESVRLMAYGNSDWKYTWDNGASGPSQKVTPVLSTYQNQTFSYSVEVEDEFNCMAKDEMKVTVISKPRTEASIIHPCNQSDGSITFNFPNHPNLRLMEFSINGKGGPFTRVLDQRNSLRFKNLAAGNYYAWVRWADAPDACQYYLGVIKLNKVADCNQQSYSIALKGDFLNGDNITEKPSQVVEPEVIIDEGLDREFRTEKSNNVQNFSDLKVYPNPLARGNSLNIKYYTEQSGGPLRILNVNGQVMKEIDADLIKPGWNQISVDLSHAATGTYIVIDNYNNYKMFIITE